VSVWGWCGISQSIGLDAVGQQLAAVTGHDGTLKGELLHDRHATRAQARSEVFEYLEVFYNRQRLHSSLGYLSPVAFETQAAARAA
jgi:transposase InsO family protein